MIQRQQTLWLLFAAITSFLTFQFPFVTGKEVITENAALADIDIDAGSNMFLLLLTGASIILALVTIFQFKDRKLQLKLTIAGILLTLVIITLYIVQYTRVIQPVPALWAILPFITLFAFIMAYRGIRNDEKLVKSLDKLR
jgi:hypothetical protein